MKTTTTNAMLRLDIKVEREEKADQPTAAKRLVFASLGQLRAGGSSQTEAVSRLLAEVRALLASPAAHAAFEQERLDAAAGRQAELVACVACGGEGVKEYRNDCGFLLTSTTCGRCLKKGKVHCGT